MRLPPESLNTGVARRSLLRIKVQDQPDFGYSWSERRVLVFSQSICVYLCVCVGTCFCVCAHVYVYVPVEVGKGHLHKQLSHLSALLCSELTEPSAASLLLISSAAVKETITVVDTAPSFCLLSLAHVLLWVDCSSLQGWQDPQFLLRERPSLKKEPTHHPWDADADTAVARHRLTPYIRDSPRRLTSETFTGHSYSGLLQCPKHSSKKPLTSLWLYNPPPTWSYPKKLTMGSVFYNLPGFSPLHYTCAAWSRVHLVTC